MLKGLHPHPNESENVGLPQDPEPRQTGEAATRKENHHVSVSVLMF